MGFTFLRHLVQHILRSDKHRRVTLEMLSGTRAGIRVHGQLLMHVMKVFKQLVSY